MQSTCTQRGIYTVETDDTPLSKPEDIINTYNLADWLVSSNR